MMVMADVERNSDPHPATPEAPDTHAEPKQPHQTNHVTASPEPGVERVSDSSSEPRPKEGYALTQRRIHWIVAALVAVQLVVGVWIGTTTRQPANESLLDTLFKVHLVTGTLIFALMVTRLRLRRQLGVPPSPAGTPFDASLLARINHQGFYILLLTLPVLGWLAYASGEPASALFGGIHGALALTLAIAVCAHLAGVIYHTYVRRDGLLRRMTL
jgi:cytochrome b561